MRKSSREELESFHEGRHEALVLTLDVGTTVVKAGLVDEQGRVLRISSEEVKLHSPEPGAVEHNPRELWNCVVRNIKHVIRGYENSIHAISISSYLFGLVVVDHEGKERTNIMTWMDTRCAEALEDVRRRADVSELYRRTGCPPLHVYMLPKIIWLKARRPEVFGGRYYLLNSKDYIISKLLGTPYTEFSTASATQMLNIHSLRWEPMALELADVDERVFPNLVDSDKILDYVKDNVAKELGLRDKLPLVPSVYDGAAFIVGLGGLKEDIAYTHLGSSAMVRVISRSPVLDKSESMRLQTYYLMRGRWVPGGAINNSGLTLLWARDSLCQVEKELAELTGINVFEIMVKMAEKVPPGAEGLICIPFFTSERLTSIRGRAGALIWGLTLKHTKAHILRALIESTAFLLKIFSLALEENGLEYKELRVGGGGAKSRLWLEIIANVLGKTVKRAEHIEMGLIGDAMIAYVALGYYKSYEEVFRSFKLTFEEIKPSTELIRRYEEIFDRFNKVLGVVERIYSKLEPSGG